MLGIEVYVYRYTVISIKTALLGCDQLQAELTGSGNKVVKSK